MIQRSFTYFRTLLAGLIVSLLVINASVIVGVGQSSTVARTNQQIVFAASVEESEFVYVIHPDGTGLQRIIGNHEGQDDSQDIESLSSPACSADGMHVGFLSIDNQLYLKDATMGRLNELNLGQLNFTDGLSLAQNDSKVSFISSRDGSSQVYVMNTDGSGLLELTSGGSGKFYPSLSPDGNKVAFESAQTSHDQIYVIHSDGSNLSQITSEPSDNGQPAWSPDGTHIAFTSYRNGRSSIYTMDANGDSIAQLTSGPGADAYPSWSPDGTQLAFVSIRGGSRQIYVMNINGTAMRQVTNLNTISSIYSPCWISADIFRDLQSHSS